MGRLYYSRVGLTMLAKHNSSHCLAKGNCKPLGGFSVWAALPPLDPAKNNTKPITLVVAQIDGIDMFHDEIVMRRWVCGRRGVLIAHHMTACTGGHWIRKEAQAMPAVQQWLHVVAHITTATATATSRTSQDTLCS
jgi:hypothetical protein